MDVIDLSVPVRHGEGRLGLQVEFATPYSYDSCGWQGSTFKMFAHYGSHVDAPIHFIRGGETIENAPLAKLMGPAGVIELIIYVLFVAHRPQIVDQPFIAAGGACARRFCAHREPHDRDHATIVEIADRSPREPLERVVEPCQIGGDGGGYARGVAPRCEIGAIDVLLERVDVTVADFGLEPTHFDTLQIGGLRHCDDREPAVRR